MPKRYASRAISSRTRASHYPIDRYFSFSRAYISTFSPLYLLSRRARKRVMPRRPYHGSKELPTPVPPAQGRARYDASAAVIDDARDIIAAHGRSGRSAYFLAISETIMSRPPPTRYLMPAHAAGATFQLDSRPSQRQRPSFA